MMGNVIDFFVYIVPVGIVILILIGLLASDAGPVVVIVLLLLGGLGGCEPIFNWIVNVDDRIVDARNSRIEAENDLLLARNIEYANKELAIYADSLGLQPGICSSTRRYGVMAPCVVSSRDKSRTVAQVFCPWSPKYHGCIVSLDPTNYQSGLLNRVEVNAMAQGNDFSENFNNNLQSPNIGNFSNKLSDNARQQSNQKNYNYAPKQELAVAAKEIQNLLEQLEKRNPIATESEKIAYVEDETTPSFKRRLVKALLSGGESAIEEFLDNPYVNVVKSVIEGWMAAKD